ncbi:MAG: arylsulfatase [Verrucomicrobiota bacterium]
MRPLLSLFFLLALLASSHALPQTTTRPNIIVILTDDMGFSDLGCFGSEISTPHLDSLATNGIRFTQFYNTARCCPSRASLLTGLHPHQTGVGHMVNDNHLPGYRGNLNRQCLTIAEVLHPAGYRNYAVGKWHVTPGQSAKALEDHSNWPLQRGFDRYYGTIHGAGSYWDPSSLIRDNTQISQANDPEYQPKEFYYTDALTDHAIRFLHEHSQLPTPPPFFLYLAYTAAHWPLHAREADIAKYHGRYDSGYASIRNARWAKQKQLGVIPEKSTLSPIAGDWSKVADPTFEARCMEVYAAMIDRMDQGVGRLLAELQAQGQLENTLIFYLQDNGACAEPFGRGAQATPRQTLPSLKPLPPDQFQYDSLPKQTRDGYPVRTGYGVLPGPPDTYIAYGQAWANVSNTPFREYKHWVHEGGISTPLIISWPATITPKKAGRISSQPGQLVDILPTIIEVASASYPTDFHGEKITPLEGISLTPTFTDRPLTRSHPLVWEHEGNRAIRQDQWKLVAKGASAPWELYDLSTDRAELLNLADSQPERVQALATQWTNWATRAQVIPSPFHQKKNLPQPPPRP